MGLFCDREETEEQIVIHVRYAWYYVYLGGVFVCIFLSRSFGKVFLVPAGVFIILMIVFTFAYWPLSAKIRKEMRNGTVKVSGSKYSFSNPLTFIITKRG